MSYKNAISSSDPQALEKLNAKLEACMKQQAFMKTVNVYWRKHGTCKGCPDVKEELAAKLDAKIERAYSWEKQPFASYELAGNNAEIKRLQKRIAEITRMKSVLRAGSLRAAKR